MTGHDFKRPGLIRAGFEYQDLVAIEVLIDFYRERDLYLWVQVDAEDTGFRSIEDVVALCPDGKYELTQVKFSGDPSDTDNGLTWNWLTAKKGKAKSLLQKWAPTCLVHVRDNTLAKATLKTNRIPEGSFANCLDGREIAFDRLTEPDRSQVIAEFDSEDDAKVFFQSFEFCHSMPLIDDFEDQLWTRIASDTDREGWLVFQRQVSTWATRKDQPKPDGRIRHIHLRQAFSVERPKPIPQSFEVPKAYQVPDGAFHARFLKEVTEQPGLSVLWGPPGRGKSTYLSHCVAKIDGKKALCIRHHYFLSLNERSYDRFHYHQIARSLEDQIEQATPDLRGSRETLSSLIGNAARRLSSEGKQLVIIIDGLDHVWREHRDHEQMEQLFSELLPLPPHTHLIVGTQQIADQYLPARLLSALAREQWTELPPMSRDAVANWVKRQDQAGRVNLELEAWQKRAKVIASLGNAFYDISLGLPLHLIYSFEALARPGGPIRVEQVTALPSCPTGDIRDYLSVTLAPHRNTGANHLACSCRAKVRAAAVCHERLLWAWRHKPHRPIRNRLSSGLSRD